MRRIALAGLLTAAMALSLAAQARAVELEPIGTFSSPVYVTSDPANPDRLFVVERSGRIRLTTKAGTSVFADLQSVVDSSGQEQGLLSMAFAPDYATSGLLYVYYTGRDAGSIHVGELAASGDTAGLGTLRNVITIPHPTYANHNGGQLQFGPDGYLYLGTGDGGGANDPFESGQSTEALLGKLLRIDPRQSGSQPYTIPPDNPFAGPGVPGADAVWSYGLRNPYRFSFDRLTGALAIGDVGQGMWEEVDYAVPPAPGRAANYGWDCREGMHDFELAGCAGVPTVDPVLEYSHASGGCSVTGGYVVRDPGLPELEGRYVYADYCAGKIRSAVLGTQGATGDRAEGLDVEAPSSFGQDSCGRIYVASLLGDVFRLEDSTPTDCAAAGGSPPDPTQKPCATELRGGGGKNRLSGGPGSQAISGLGGNDRLSGGAGDDCLSGGRGSDRLGGGAGEDLLRGGAGGDLLRADDGERDRVLCGRGRDRARVDRIDRVEGCEHARKHA